MSSTDSSIDEKVFDTNRRSIIDNYAYQQVIIHGIIDSIKSKFNGDMPQDMRRQLLELSMVGNDIMNKAMGQFYEFDKSYPVRDDAWVEEMGDPNERAKEKYSALVSSLGQVQTPLLNRIGHDDNQAASIDQDSMLSSQMTSSLDGNGDCIKDYDNASDTSSTNLSFQQEDGNTTHSQDNNSTTLGEEEDGNDDSEGNNSLMALGVDVITHSVTSQQINSTNIEMIESNYIGMDGSSDSLQYMLCHLDTSTVINKTVLRSFFVSKDLSMIEKKMSLLPAILKINSLVALQSSKKAQLKLDKKFASMKSGSGLACTLRALDANALTSANQAVDQTIIDAAKLATQKLTTSSRTWIQHSTLQKEVKTSTQLVLFILAGIRVLKQLTFDEFIAKLPGTSNRPGVVRKLLEKYRSFCDSIIGDGGIGNHTLAQLLEKVIMPSVLGDGGSPIVEKERVEALEVLQSITKELSSSKWKTYYEITDALPLEILIGTCSQDDVDRYLLELEQLEQAGQDVRYLSDKTERSALTRRQCAMRAIFYLVQSPVVAQTLETKGLLSEQHANYLPFAFLCSPSTHLTKNEKSGFDFFHDMRFVRASTDASLDSPCSLVKMAKKGEKGEKLTVRDSLEGMFTRMSGSMEVFRNNHVYADLTGDSDNEVVLRLFSTFSDLGNDDEDDDTSGVERVPV